MVVYTLEDDILSEERYDFAVGPDGLEYDLLDYAFNRTTENFISKNGIKHGMRVLDVGSGSGAMSQWLAKQVGSAGHIVSIDNSQEQLDHAKRNLAKTDISNVTFKLLSAYDLKTLEMDFDLVYCRFVLHHLHSPRKAMKIFYDILKPGGIYIAEEGIVSSAFSYPYCEVWQETRPTAKPLEKEIDGKERDGNFGMKLFYNMYQVGFSILDSNLVQPIFTTKEEKSMLLGSREVFKLTALSQGTTEEEWDRGTAALQKFVDDKMSIAGFYQSCQVAGKK